VSGRVVGTFVGMVALLIAVPAHADTGVGSGGVGVAPTQEPASAPVAPAPAGGSGDAFTHVRPVLTVFDAASASSTTSGTLVRFRIRDRARSVRVRLAFVSLADGTTYRVNLGRQRTRILHTYAWSGRSGGEAVAAGTYRVRITARNPRGKSTVRGTTVLVSAPTVPVSAGHTFPVAGAYTFGGPDARFGARRSGHTHQGQDMPAAEGTPLVAVAAGTIVWRAYQEGGAGYYLVLDADAENYNYVYMHLQRGSLLVGKGDRVAVGQRIGSVGNTGGSEGPHLHFEVWDGPWYAGGHPVDPLPFLQAWQ
jgi:murein DD-endopeptidase MepM/ murein hydrolase activator NlpD